MDKPVPPVHHLDEMECLPMHLAPVHVLRKLVGIRKYAAAGFRLRWDSVARELNAAAAGFNLPDWEATTPENGVGVNFSWVRPDGTWTYVHISDETELDEGILTVREVLES